MLESSGAKPAAAPAAARVVGKGLSPVDEGQGLLTGVSESGARRIGGLAVWDGPVAARGLAERGNRMVVLGRRGKADRPTVVTAASAAMKPVEAIAVLSCIFLCG